MKERSSQLCREREEKRIFTCEKESKRERERRRTKKRAGSNVIKNNLSLFVGLSMSRRSKSVIYFRPEFPPSKNIMYFCDWISLILYFWYFQFIWHFQIEFDDDNCFNRYHFGRFCVFVENSKMWQTFFYVETKRAESSTRGKN